MAWLMQDGYVLRPNDEVPAELVDRVAAFFAGEPAAQSLTIEMGPGRWAALAADPDMAERDQFVVLAGIFPTEAEALRALGG